MEPNTDLTTEHRSRPARATTRRLDVLVVEDDADAAYMLACLLERRGHRTVVTGDADAALDALRERVPDVALIDIGLPTMDGNALAARIRKTHGPAVRLIAATGHATPADRERARAAGFDALIPKPLDLRELLRAVGGADTLA